MNAVVNTTVNLNVYEAEDLRMDRTVRREGLDPINLPHSKPVCLQSW